jgi:hypothetical protein
LLDPGTDKCPNFILQVAGFGNPTAQEIAKILESKKEVLRCPQSRCRAAYSALGIENFGWPVGRSAYLADIPILIRSSALWAGALNVPVGEETATNLAIILLDFASGDVASVLGS